MNQIVINGDNIELLKKYPDNYFDAVVTDPPYGLGKEPNAEELMKDWIEKGYHEISGKGFMGKEWDAFIPQPVFWKEVFRVLKHGGHVLSFFGTRTYDWGVVSMRFAGFEVRDCIQWLYGSGFPKSHNIGKAVDALEKTGKSNPKALREYRMGDKYKPTGQLDYKKGRMFGNDIENDNTEQTITNDWEGWGSALKPANEPIVLARKPLEKGLSIAENILKWGVGGINIDASRIGLPKDDPQVKLREGKTIHAKGINEVYSNGVGKIDGNYFNQQGRFPANIILTHHEDCECKGTKKVKAIKGGNSGTIGNEVYGKFNGEKNNDGCGFGDENGQEEVEDWDCHEDCPIRILDEQSGDRSCTRIGNDNVLKKGENNIMFGGVNQKKENTSHHYRDKGGASRFFYVAKASKAERNKGLKGFDEKLPNTNDFNNLPSARSNSINTSSGKERVVLPNQNFHPTVKPIKLMQYLVKMITPPNGIVLDPFCGSGTTGVACKIDGFQFVGLEQDPEYAKIAEARIANYKPEASLTKKSKEKPNLEQIPLF
jgi:site-specific DNA-methyltransferase (adenine-specific)